MTNYELLYIISPKTDDAAREELIERFRNVVIAAGGSAEVNKWGMRKLAYKINFQSEGYYVLMTFSAPEDLPAELERLMRITDSVMRFMVTKKVENKLTRAESERRAKAAEKAAAAAKAREEAIANAAAKPVATEEVATAEPVTEEVATEAVEQVEASVDEASDVAAEAADNGEKAE